MYSTKGLICWKNWLNGNNGMQSNIDLTNKCGPVAVCCWKKSVIRKCCVQHSFTNMYTTIANICRIAALEIASLLLQNTISKVSLMTSSIYYIEWLDYRFKHVTFAHNYTTVQDDYLNTISILSIIPRAGTVMILRLLQHG